MSVVISAKYKDGIAIIADKQVTCGTTKSNNGNKLQYFKYSNSAIGVVGYLRDCNIIRTIEEILPYKDIIIFKGSDTPLVWDIPFTFERGTLYFGKNNQIEMKDPEDIGKELSSYLSSRPRVPNGIDEFGTNNIGEWINKLE